MKTKTLTITAILALLISAAGSAFAAPGEHKTAPKPPPNISSPELNRIKALEGRWKSTTSMFGKENEEVFTEYAVTAGGSAVVETAFPGTPQEMISVYYDDDNGKLAMTHYCMMRNRPYFSLVESSKDKLKLDVTKVEGVKSKDDPSMGAITIQFEDEDHYTATCEAGGDGKDKHEPMAMRYTRVKK